jgi:hypothetical protein
METTQGSETSAYQNLTPGKYPKEYTQYSTHGGSHPALEDGTDTGFRNVGLPKFDAGEIPKRIHTIFHTRRKFEIKYKSNVSLSK